MSADDSRYKMSPSTVPPWVTQITRLMNRWGREAHEDRDSCIHERIIAIVIASNGQRQPRYVCVKCGHYVSMRKPEIIRWRDEIATAPVVRDNRARCCYGTGCEQCVPPEFRCRRCGSCESVERHHWAPWHLFEDAHEWPQDWLCRRCHNRWHKTVTPNMGKRDR